METSFVKQLMQVIQVMQGIHAASGKNSLDAGKQQRENSREKTAERKQDLSA